MRRFDCRQNENYYIAAEIIFAHVKNGSFVHPWMMIGSSPHRQRQQKNGGISSWEERRK